MSWRKKIQRAVFVIFCLGVLVSLMKTLVETYRIDRRVEVLVDEVELLAIEKDQLIDEKAYKESRFFLEKEARDKLNLVRDGDTIVVIKNDETHKTKLDAAIETDVRSVSLQWQDLILYGLH